MNTSLNFLGWGGGGWARPGLGALYRESPPLVDGQTYTTENITFATPMARGR